MPEQRSDSPKRTSLLVSRGEAAEKIQAQIAEGEELQSRTFESLEEYEEAIEAEWHNWRLYCFELLGRLFTDDSIQSEFGSRLPNIYSFGNPDGVIASDVIEGFPKAIGRDLRV